MGMVYIERLAPPHSFPAEFLVQHEKVTADTILSSREVMRMERKHSWRISEILEASETDERLARTETYQVLGWNGMEKERVIEMHGDISVQSDLLLRQSGKHVVTWGELEHNYFRYFWTPGESKIWTKIEVAGKKWLWKQDPENSMQWRQSGSHTVRTGDCRVEDNAYLPGACYAQNQITIAAVLSPAQMASLGKAAVVSTEETRWMGAWILVPKHVHLFQAVRLSFGILGMIVL